MSDTPTLVFDVGNVLIQWAPHLAFPGRDRQDIEAFFDEVGFAVWNMEQDRGRTWAEGVAHLTALYPHLSDLIAQYDRNWQLSVSGPVSGMPELLAELDQSGADPLFAITNFSGEKWAETRDRFPFLANTFADVVVSAHERRLKPEPAIYDTLCRRNGLDPRACFFIDDSALNVAGARHVGMRAHHFKDAQTLRRELLALGFQIAA